MKKSTLLIPAIALMVAFGANAQSLTSVVQKLEPPIPARLLPEPTAPSAANRTITITHKTRSVNVNEFETVAFRANGKVFAVYFDSPNTVSNLDLRRVAPAGVLDHPVTVYIKTTKAD